MCFKLFQKKSFDLINEKETKNLKHPKKFRWLQLLVIPSLVCFALTLILVNVDFYGNGSANMCTTQNPIENMESTVSLQHFAGEIKAKSLKPIAPHTDICTKVRNNPCKLTCTVMSSDQNVLNRELESQYKICNGPMEVIMIASLFNDNTLNKADLNGNFRLANLTFYGCILNNIADGAFDKSSLNNLENLQLLGVKLERMSDKTFAGLEKLSYLEINNQPLSKKLTANAILKPLAATLKTLIFTHDSAIEFKFDPGKCLNGAELTALTHVDLKNNYFTDTLQKSSFGALKSVEYLSLHNCYIESLKDDTFEPILGTLRHLILSQNKLKHLSPHLVADMVNAEVELTLTKNLWHCTCPNYKLIEAVKNDQIKLTDVPICSVPSDFENCDMKSVKICCAENRDECEENTATIKNTIITTEKTITTNDPISPPPKHYDDEPFPEIKLICMHFPVDKEKSMIHTKDELAYFQIATTSETSVEISFKAIPPGASLLYFNNHTNNSEKFKTLHGTHITLNNLWANEAYAFCLVPLNERLMSPFNCRSHYLAQIKEYPVIEAWLTSEDLAIFISLTTFGFVVCLLFGLIAGYLVLRWRPTLLRSKRLVKLSTDSKQVFLEKSRKKLTTDELYEAIRNYAAVYQFSSNDYVKYYNSSELSIDQFEILSSTENIPPWQRAPALPPICQLRSTSTQSTILADDIVSLKTIPEDLNEHEYQSLEGYHSFYDDVIASINN